MNVLIFSHSSGVRGGAERALLDIIDGLPKKIKPTVCLPSGGELVSALKKRNVPFVLSNLHTGWNFEQDFVHNISSVNVLLNKLKKEQYALIISNSSVYPLGGIVAHELKLPHLWIVHEIIQKDATISERIKSKDIYNIGELSDYVLANSNATKESLIKYIDSSKLKLQYLPIKLSNKYEKKVAIRKITDSVINVVCLGRVIPLKRQLDVVKALDIINKNAKYNIALHLVGEADQTYLNQIQKANIKGKVKIIYHGHTENIEEVLNIAHIGVISSEVESFGRATYEMLAHGIPVIGTNSGATPELISDGFNGYLYEVGDTKALAKCLVKIIDSTENYLNLSANALKIKDKYEYSKLIKKYTAIIEETSKIKVKYTNNIIDSLFSKSVEEICLMDSEINKLNNEVLHLKAELQEIYSSKAWRAIKKARDTKGRLKIR